MKSAVSVIVLFAGVLAAAHLLAPLLPQGLTWGFHFLSFLGPWHAAAYAALVAMVLAAGATGRIDAAAGRLAALSENSPSVTIAAALVLFAAAGFAFRVDVPLLGDSWYLVQNFAGALRGTEEVLPRNEPLATYYLYAVLGFSGVSTYAGFLDALFAGGMLLGVGYLAVAYASTRLLFSDRRERAVSFILLCSLPCMVLFFGYVEVYGVVLFMLSLYALAGILYLKGRIPFGVAAMAFLAQALTHFLTVLTIPSLVYLGIVGVRRGKRKDVAIGIAVSSAAVLLLLAAVGFDVTNYGSYVPHRHYLPLTAPEELSERYSTPYTLFSLYHYIDLFNLGILLLAPAAALALAGWGTRRSRMAGGGGTPARAAVEGRRSAVKDPAGEAERPRPGFPDGISRPEVFLLASALPVALFAFVAKFDLGTARDWDVIGPYSYLVVLGAAAAYFRLRPGAGGIAPAGMIAGITLLNSVLWWTVTGSDTAAVERFRSLMEPRLTGQAGMYNGSLYLSRYFRQTGKSGPESAELWLRYIARYPGDIRGFRNVLLNTKEKGAVSAAQMIRDWSRAFGRNPVTDRTMVTLAIESGNEALDENRDADAGEFYAAAADIDPRSAPAWNNLGTVLARREDFEGAAEMFRRAVGIDTAFADAWFNLGRASLATGKSAEARRAFGESARLGNRAAQSLLSTGSVQP